MNRIRLTERLDRFHEPEAVLTLPFDMRQKSRFRAVLDDGREAQIVLPRGSGVLRGGELLGGPEAPVVVVLAALEPVSTASHRDPRLLARAAYHLGNRHVPLQVGGDWVRYHADHVLDAMVHSLGLRVLHEQARFEPEAGAYGHHGSRQTEDVLPAGHGRHGHVHG